MTAFDKTTDLPATVNSVEKLFIWATMVLARVNPTRRVVESPDLSAINVVVPNVIKADDNTVRFVGRVSIELDSNYGTGTQKLWEFAKDLDNVAIPSNYKS
jgi:hypothetical protein